MRVLLVEDQNIIRQGLRKIISEIPELDIEEAEDGAQAWALYGRRPADLVITDIVMPDMDGLDLISRISACDDDCAAVVISGYDKFDYAQRAMMYGVRSYLLKPMRREKILAVVRRHKAEYEERRERREKLFACAWNAGLAGEHERVRDELTGMRAKSAGCLIAARSAVGACPLPEETGYLLCRQLARVGADTALFCAHGPFADERRAEQIALCETHIEAGEEFSQALLQLTQRWTEGASDDYGEAMRRVLLYISRHYGEPLSLQGVAEQVNLHPNYLSALFTRSMHCGFTHYLQRLRVEKAKTLLRTTSQKVNAIALSVGFTDGKYFTKVFKALTGITPQQYRAE